MNRRTWLTGAVGTLAAAGGAAWYRWNRVDDQANGADAAVAAELWALRLPRPEGGELALATLRGRPLLVNFWATWCPPCVRELPLLDRFVQAQSANGWRVVGIAIDGPAPVQEFLRRTPLGFPVGLAGLEGTTLVRRLGNPGGGLPFSIALDRQGRLRERHLGELSEAVLRQWSDRLASASISPRIEGISRQSGLEIA
jgi:thiol-disulfide isomerase/thioredoxin